jgi:hypothetical protein
MLDLGRPTSVRIARIQMGPGLLHPTRRSMQQRPVKAIARGRDGQFIPAGLCWVVERALAYSSRYQRLKARFELSKEHLIAFVAIAFISILSRRVKRIVVEELSDQATIYWPGAAVVNWLTELASPSLVPLLSIDATV